MPAVLLTTGNIRALKAGLREGLPQIKSSHLSEALAYGVGFRTHAALAAKIGSTTRSFLVDIDLRRISDRIVDLGGQGYDDAHLLHITRASKIPDGLAVQVCRQLSLNCPQLQPLFSQVVCETKAPPSRER